MLPKFAVTVQFDTAAEAALFLQAAGDQTQPVADAPSEAPAAPKASRKRAAPEAVATPAQAPAAPQAPAPSAAEAVTKETVVKKLVTLINANDALGKNGKQVCTDLCNKFGGKNASAINPARYGEVVAAVDAALEALNSDPTA